MWTQLHDGGYCYMAMTTNVSECFNGVLKGASGLPIVAMVEFTQSKLVTYFHDRHKEITHDLSKGLVWSKYALKIYGQNLQKSLTHQINTFNNLNGIYQVITTYNIHSSGGGHHSHEVNVMGRTCHCGKWQNRKIPCSHAIKALQHSGKDAITYIDPCYSLENANRTYLHAFVVPKSESLWRDVDGPKWVPDLNLLQAKGRPVASRIQNEMDGVWRELGSRRPDSDLREIHQKQSCGLCHQHGHNCRRCPLSFGALTSNNDPNQVSDAFI